MAPASGPSLDDADLNRSRFYFEHHSQAKRRLESVASEHRNTRPWIAWLVALSIGLVGLSRETDVSVFNSLFAEDGSIFLPGASEGSSLFDGYGGYFHAVPRLLSVPVAALPVEAWPTAASLLHLAVVSSVAVFLYYATERFISSRLLRALLGAWMLLNPIASETVGNLTNLHWYLLVGAFWAVFAPDRASLNVSGFGITIATALSNPVTGFIGLLAMMRARRDRSPRLLVLGSTAIMLSAIHLLAGSSQSAPALDRQSLTSAAILWIWAIVGSIGGTRLVAGLVENPVIPTALAAIPLWVAFHSTRPYRRLVVASTLAFTFVLIVVPSILRGVTEPVGNARYVLAPAALILATFMSLVSRNRWGAIALGTVVVISIAIGFTSDSRSYVQPWSEALQVDAGQCVTLDVATVDISPPGWQASVECQHINKSIPRP